MSSMTAMKNRLSMAIIFKIISAMLGFIFTAIISRSLSDEQAGLFFSLLSSLIVITTVLIAGRDIYVMRLTTRYFVLYEFAAIIKFQNLVKSQVFITFLIATIIYFLVEYFYTLTVFNNNKSIKVFVLCMPFYAITIINCELLRGVGNLKSLIFLHGIVLPFLSGLLVLILIHFGIANLFLACIMYFIAVFIVWVSSEFLWHQVKAKKFLPYNYVKRKDAKKVTINVSSYSAFAVIGIANVIMQYIPMFFLGLSSQPGSAGLFFVALKIATLLSFSLMAINVVIAPLMAQAHQLKDLKGLKKLLIVSNLVGFFTGLPIIVALFLFGDIVLSFFGAVYVDAFDTMKILLLGQFINASSGSVLHLLMMTGYEKYVAIITTLGVAIVVVVQFFVGEMSNLTLAWALTIAITIINIVSLVMSYILVFSSKRLVTRA